MPLYKPQNSPCWWIDIRHDGRRIRRSTGTADRRQAQEYHDRVAAELWRADKLGESRATWAQAVKRWLTEHAHKRSIDDDRDRLRWLSAHLGASRALAQIDTALIEALIEAKSGEWANNRPPERSARARKVSNATVNRTLEVLSMVLNAAHAWGWLAKVPKIRRLHEPKARKRYLTREQLVCLIAELPEHLADMAAFAVVTGLRENNVLGLRWRDVDLERAAAWVWHDEAKAGDAIAVPLSPEAVAILQGRIGRHATWCFTYRRPQRDGRAIEEPVTKATNHAWIKAKERAGIDPRFRWHDLRHTWATWHAMAGTPMDVLQQLGGWKTPAMVREYAHFSPGYVAGYARNLRAPSGQDMAIPESKKAADAA